MATKALNEEPSIERKIAWLGLIGKEFESARQARKISQDDLARSSNITLQELCNLERGYGQNVLIETLRDIASRLQHSLVIGPVPSDGARHTIGDIADRAEKANKDPEFSLTPITG